MIRALLILTVMVMSAATANAGLSRGDLATVSATLPPNAHIALDISLHDTAGRALTMRQLLDGRSALVTFVDFTCTSLCGSDLRLLSGAIEAAGITDARLLVIGIDPKDTPDAAESMAAAEIPPAILANTLLLLPDQTALARMTASLGFHYVYDATIDQFAHPAAVYALSATGAVGGLMSPFALDPLALKAALATPSLRRPSFSQTIRNLCYALNPATGLIRCAS